MIHAGVLLKIGAYGIIRFGMGIFPEQYKSLAFIVVLFGVLSLLYGAFLALVQTDFKLVLAYSSVSHMGIVMMGLGALNESGIQGAIFQVISHGLIVALLFFLVAVLYERTGTTMFNKLGGLTKSMPIFSGLLLAGGMASSVCLGCLASSVNLWYFSAYSRVSHCLGQSELWDLF